VLLGGCGGDGEPGAEGSPPTAEHAASAASRALEEAGSFRFESTLVRERADAADEGEEYATSAGVVHPGDDRGEMELVLEIPELADAEAAFGEPIGLRWDEHTVEIRLGEETRRVERGDAREDGGLLGRFPDEPGGLVTLLTIARDAEEIGRETIGGRETTGYRFAVDRRAAGQAGVPVELSRALEEGQPDIRLALEAWLDADALPRRLAYVVDIDPVLDEESGRELLPARTIRGTYDLSDFGVAVDVSVRPPDE
jgi:hypothetical protein